jgi:hypothetical protein
MDQHRKGMERPLHAQLGRAAACEWQKWRSAIAPYRLGSQSAADMKIGRQTGSGEISAAVGYLSYATKSTYGHANMCKGRSLAPAWVRAARPVKVCSIPKLKIKAAR